MAQTWGDWTQVVCANGWSGWVDGRVLVPRTAAPAAPVATMAAPSTGGAAAVSVDWALRARTGWIALAGAAAIGLSALLPWLKLGGGSADGFDVPAEFLLSYKAETDLGFDVGVLLIVLALAGVAAVLVAPDDWWRRGVGIAAGVVALLYVIQVQRLLSASPAEGRPGLLSTVGVGAYLALAGAGALAAGPWLAAPERGT